MRWVNSIPSSTKEDRLSAIQTQYVGGRGSGSTIPPSWLETPPTVTNARSYHSATLADLANASFRRLNMTIPPSWVGTPPTLTNASATLADLANESFRRLNMYTAIYLIEIAEMQTDD